MTYSVQFNDEKRGITLMGYKQHISLYGADLAQLVKYGVTKDHFIKRAEDWLWDIICDEYGSDNVRYDGKALTNALGVIFDNLRKDFEHSSGFKAEEEKAIIAERKRQEELKKQVPLNPILDAIYERYRLKYASFAMSSPRYNYNIEDNNSKKMNAYHNMEKYIGEHLEEFAPLTESERIEKADKLFRTYADERGCTY